MDARLALWLAVGISFVVLLYENRDQWFGGDEWNIITDRGLTAGAGHEGLFEPHFEHWSTLPIAAYRLLFSVFGLHSYWPYVVVLLVVHLTIVVLLWHVMVRCGTDPWVATAACAVFSLLGNGFENLTGAWQAPLIAPLALGLGALLLVPERGPLQRRDAAASSLLLVAVMCSGVALPMLVVVAIVQLARRGWRVAAATVAVPVAAYGVWYLFEGRHGQAVATDSLGDVPDFVWSGLTHALGDVVTVEVLGTIVVIAILGWLAWKLLRDRHDERLIVPVALAIGGVIFLTSTGIRRANLFLSDPAASRYAYVTIAFVVPLLAYAAQRLFSGSAWRRALLAALAVTLLVVQVTELDREAAAHAKGEQIDRGAVLATAQLAREGRTFLLDRPLYAFEPQVTVDEIVSMDRDGKLPNLGDATLRDRLTVLARLDVTVGPDPAVSAGEPRVVAPSRQVELRPQPNGCAAVAARGPSPQLVVRFATRGVFRISGEGPIVLRLRDEQHGVEGASVTFYLAPGRSDFVSVGSADGALVVSWFPQAAEGRRGHVERLCDVDVA